MAAWVRSFGRDIAAWGEEGRRLSHYAGAATSCLQHTLTMCSRVCMNRWLCKKVYVWCSSAQEFDSKNIMRSVRLSMTVAGFARSQTLSAGLLKILSGWKNSQSESVNGRKITAERFGELPVSGSVTAVNSGHAKCWTTALSPITINLFFGSAELCLYIFETQANGEDEADGILWTFSYFSFQW